MLRAILLAGLLLQSLIAAPALAQSLRGTLRSPEGRAVPGALFTLLDASGHAAGQTVTGARGEFSFDPGGGGSYALRVERIGQLTFTGDPFTIHPDTTLTLNLQVQSQPVGLGGVRAATSPCTAGGPGGIVAVVWEQATKALRIRLLAEQQGLLQVSGVRYVRMLDNSYRVRQGIVDEEPFSGRAMPFPTLQPEAGFDFASPDSTGTLQYLVPSPAVLLTDAFLQQHCVHQVSTDPRDAGRVGLGFRPLPRNETAGVAGTLWLDRDRADVQLLEFEYQDPRGRVPRGAHGLVDFAYDADSLPVISRWWLRVPRTFETTHAADERAERRTVPIESGALAFGPDQQPIEDPENLLPLMTGVITLDAVVVQAKRTQFEAELDAKPWHWTRTATSVIRPAELLGAPQSSAYDVVKALRAHWLVPQPGTNQLPVVYFDNIRMTDRRTSTEDALRAIPAADIGAIERIRAIEAAQLFGALEGTAFGVIVVYSRRW